MNFTAEDIITRVTDKEIRQSLPCLIFIGSLIVIGVIGNIHVIILFSRTDRKPSTYTVFVKALAIVDLMTCCIQMPMEIYDFTRPYTFFNILECKVSHFIMVFLEMCSISILALIAFERYRRVCSPLKIQMTVFKSKWLCLLLTLISIIISLPMCFLCGHRIVNLQENGVNATGIMCHIDDKYRGTVLLYSYLGFMFIVFVLFALFLIVAYVSITRVVLSRHDSLKVYRKNDISTVSESDVEPQAVAVSGKHLTVESVESRTKKMQRSAFKTTRPLIVITGIFLLVFPPYLILNCIAILNDQFRSNLNSVELIIYQIGVRLLFINNVANPFVYGFTDERFKQRITSVYCKKNW